MPDPKSILDDLDAIKDEQLPGTTEFVERVKARTNGHTPAVKAAGRKTSTPAPPYREGMFVEPLTKLYALMGLAVLPFKENTGVTLMENAEACATSWDGWAKTSPKVRKALAPLLNASGATQVAIAHAPIAMAVVGELSPRYANAMMKVGARLAEMMARKNEPAND